MNDKYRELIENGVGKVLDGYDFKRDGDRFSNGKVIAELTFNDETNMTSLKACLINENGEEAEGKELASWLLDDSATEKDAKTILGDYLECLHKEFGIEQVKPEDGKKNLDLSKSKLPKKSAVGEAPNIEGFTQRFLAVFPEFKPAYSEHIDKYGEFLAVEFYKQYGSKKLKELMENSGANKKVLSKYLLMLSKMYTDGTKEVAAIITGVIIAGAFDGDMQKFDSMAEYFEDTKYLKSASRSMVALSAKNKKLKEALN